jgi:cell wall-associated NlpC family hydrolase
MATRGMSGTALTLGAVGSLLIYAGIKGTNPLDEIRGIFTGTPPEPLSRESTYTPITQTGSGTGESTGTSSSALLNAARRYLGRPYRWGGTFAGNAGGDCSGLVYRACLDIGLKVPRHTTVTWPLSSHAIRVSAPSVGDLVVWPGMHMGIHSGSGQMLHAPRTGDVVKFASYTSSRSGRQAVYLRVKTGVLTTPSRGPN